MRILRSTVFGTMGAIVAVFLAVSIASANTSALSADSDADLLPGRTEVTVTVNVTCTLNDNAALTVHIYQPVGRLINIGIGNEAFTCDGNAQSFPVTVTAVEGMKFQPGPATLVVRNATGAGMSIDATYDAGAKVKLK